MSLKTYQQLLIIECISLKKKSAIATLHFERKYYKRINYILHLDENAADIFF